MNEPLPDGYVAHLPPARHRFGDPVWVEANSALDRPAQTERTCQLCGAVKVTVHGADGSGWREWRRGATTAQSTTEVPCSPQVSP